MFYFPSDPDPSGLGRPSCYSIESLVNTASIATYKCFSTCVAPVVCAEIHALKRSDCYLMCFTLCSMTLSFAHLCGECDQTYLEKAFPSLSVNQFCFRKFNRIVMYSAPHHHVAEVVRYLHDVSIIKHIIHIKLCTCPLPTWRVMMQGIFLIQIVSLASVSPHMAAYRLHTFNSCID